MGWALVQMFTANGASTRKALQLLIYLFILVDKSLTSFESKFKSPPELYANFWYQTLLKE